MTFGKYAASGVPGCIRAATMRNGTPALRVWNARSSAWRNAASGLGGGAAGGANADVEGSSNRVPASPAWESAR